ncbi:MAG: FAD-dependent oxidoreductase [Capsulimonadaceae bacterium]
MPDTSRAQAASPAKTRLPVFANGSDTSNTSGKDPVGNIPSSCLLPEQRLERVEGWGMSCHGLSYVYRPVNVEGIEAVLDAGRAAGRPVGLRGAGRSYGDAAINSEGIVLDLTRMNRILAWDPVGGRISVEPGVTIKDLWQYTIEDGWWPSVVSGTMAPTIGGAAGMNIHGKNNFKAGPIGDHIIDFDIVTPAGERLVCSREQNAELFHAAIGGLGVLGVFTRLTLQLKRVYSGLLDVTAYVNSNFDELFALYEEHLPHSDYLVGWIDCFAGGSALGRGVIHQANYLAPGVDPCPEQSLRVCNQELPDTILGLVPKSIMWRFMQPFCNDPGMLAINSGKYASSVILENGSKIRQSHAGFAFLLDYVPDWKFTYKPHGLIQYQSFIPKERAKDVFSEQLRLSQSYGIVPYLGVFKRHKPDSFLLTHAVDGFSLALDYPVVPDRRGELLSLTAEMDRVVIDAGGRFYMAKDSTLRRTAFRAGMGEDRLARFHALKKQHDPDDLLQTNLYRRLVAPE